MPVVSGLEALKLYRFSTPKPIPVLILSANVTTECIGECQRAGAAEFIPKPLRALICWTQSSGTSPVTGRQHCCARAPH